MKKIFIPIVITIAAIFFASCDKIEGPFIEVIHTEDVDVEFPDLDPSNVYRKILLEEYTGHNCSNCPDGHRKLEEILETYGDTLIAIGLHTGVYARPNNSSPHDFRTPAGDELMNDYVISAWPTAIINRKHNAGGGLAVSVWENAVQNVDRSHVYAAIQMINQFNTSDSSLKVNVKVSMLNDYDNPVRLSLFLVEDGIVSRQLKGSEYIEDYVHNHVLRNALNGTYGEQLTVNGILEKGMAYTYGCKVSLKYRDLNPDSSNDIHFVQPNPDNCYVVAILFDKANDEILQIEKLNVK